MAILTTIFYYFFFLSHHLVSFSQPSTLSTSIWICRWCLSRSKVNLWTTI